MIPLIAALLMRSIARWAAVRTTALTAGAGFAGAALTDVINLDFLRQESIRIAPGSDPEALEEAARTAARLLGLAGDEVLWPMSRNGTFIVPRYLTIDIARGRAWYSTRHYSRKSAMALGRRRWWKPRRFSRGSAGTSNVVVTK